MDKTEPDMWKGFNQVNMSVDILEIRDNGGRRSGIDRRYYSYSGHIPERRKEINRRKLEDRRQDFMPANSYQEEKALDFERRGVGFKNQDFSFHLK